MSTFAPRPAKDLKKAASYFLKMYNELDLEKYKLAKYQELFKLSSFQNMHDADLAYYTVYNRCAENAQSKESLLNCLAQEEKFSTKHPDAFSAEVYREQMLKAIKEITHQIKTGNLDYLYF
ncbi:MAG: hypothetical protein ACXVB0_21400 [Mucilaginibacter sp.]